MRALSQTIDLMGQKNLDSITLLFVPKVYTKDAEAKRIKEAVEQ